MNFASSSSVPPSGSSKDYSSVATHSSKSLESRPLATDMLPGLPVVQVKPMALGTPEFEEKRAALLEAFAAKVPAELRLPLEVIQDPPTDVTSIPTTCGILSPEEIIITENYDAVGLLEAIGRRKHPAVAVAQAFCKRSIIAHQLTCCLTQWFMAEAIEQAQKLDAFLEAHGKPIGPLHGLPISIKDHIQVAGTSSSQGCFISISDDGQDADIVSILRAQGAIIYCKTNQPQSLMHLESDSHWGRVLNPFNIHLSAGGSTGALPFDPNVVRIPWIGLETQFNRRLKVGIISNDGFIEPQPPVKRAISWARSLLSDSKFANLIEMKEFKIFGAEEAWNQVRRLYWPDGGHLTKNGIISSGEPLHPLTEWIYRDAEPLGMHTAVDLTAVHKQRDDFRLAFAKSWSEQDVDVIIGPSFVGPACAHDTAFYWTYTSLYNLVDYPGAVIPTPIRAESGEVYDTGYVPLSDACRHVRDLWEEGDFGGAPVNLQVVARRYHDNELFGALRVLKDVLDLS
ncbi:general amidase [Fusarium tjaetaba]|uniref:General amidase n=1 Tax=Fusarium tjaetaba TaxID=1567544 RepID=A0A8H5RDL7_9HYPO|nr:general amidase [Fusarium tjaetaba]KAF5630988.1 general amidase [Fusarium tjaetaba]